MKRLSAAQVEQFHSLGYVCGLPIFSEEELAPIRAEYLRVRGLLPEGVHINFVNWWHKKNRLFYDLFLDPRILDCVEDVLGPDFFLWGSQFFTKQPGDEYVVPWHQDAQYWPLEPQNSATVFLALWDCDRRNACMEVVPGTHRAGILKHHVTDDGRMVLRQEIDAGEFDPARAVPLELAAGEISLHDDAIVHGSGPNRSDRPRVGLTWRFSATEVKCDLSVWPTFQAFPARGIDRFRHNPPGVPPTENGFPTTMRP
jgi:ectoine hydroxylase-related dioxygenase (phytanoyl-CoA dioxygenase family)